MYGLRRLFQIGLPVSGYLLGWLLVRLHLWRPSVTPALGKSLPELFAEFEAHPMAAASIAQVHRARLRDGRPVVVKIRRPSGEEAMIEPKNVRTTRRVYRETAGQVEP